MKSVLFLLLVGSIGYNIYQRKKFHARIKKIEIDLFECNENLEKTTDEYESISEEIMKLKPELVSHVSVH